MQIVIVSYEKITGAASMVYTIQIDVPQAAIRPFGINPSGDDVLEHDMEIVALRPVPATPILTITVKNESTAIN